MWRFFCSGSVEYSDDERDVDILEDSEDEFSDNKLMDLLIFHFEGSRLDEFELLSFWRLFVVDVDVDDLSLSVADAEDVRI